MIYPKSSIVKRFIQNVKVYGFLVTFQKVKKRTFGGAIKVLPTLEDFYTEKITVDTNISSFISHFYSKPNKSLLDEAHDWYSDWSKWTIEKIPLAPNEWNAGPGLAISLYILIRTLKPSLVVETGTANGASSAAICAALDANDFGKLETFDIYDFDLSYVPENLFYRVTRHIVTKRAGLKDWLEANQQQIDANSIFLHDSNHSYEHQSWEYEIAYKHGFRHILSDDVHDSRAFLEIKNKFKCVYVDGKKLIGICKFI